jgi:hypothetical protein
MGAKESNMPHEIKESDWKTFRRLHEVALERFCKRVIEEINPATSDCNETYHVRYLEVFDLIMDRNEKMARAFDDIRRSRAFLLLANIRQNQLLTDEEFSEFSVEARESVESIFQIRRI